LNGVRIDKTKKQNQRPHPPKPRAGHPIRLKIYRPGHPSEAFWQRRFYDFNVWSEKKVKEKLEYMHANPVNRELVLHAREWPWSSWSYYTKGEKGLIRIDSLEEKEQGVIRQARKKQSQNPHP